MDDPILTIEERAAINAGRWFTTLSPSLRHDILRCAFVKRYRDGDMIAVLHEHRDEADKALSLIKATWKRNDPVVDDKTIFDYLVKPIKTDALRDCVRRHAKKPAAG